MICGTFSTVVPTEADANVAVMLYKLNSPPPNSVTKTKDPAPATTWTVTADFGACAPNTTHSPAGS